VEQLGKEATMKGYICRIPAGLTEMETVTEVTDPSVLSQLREVVGGYIEVVPRFSKFALDDRTVTCVAFCNEMGKLHNLPYNMRATELWHTQLGFDPHDVLAGDVAIVWGDEEFMNEL
jgi:hypothetical protein